jgi:uncharacterized membrane protein
VVTPLVAAIVFVTLIALSRGLRRVYRWLAELLGRWFGARAARVVGWASVAVGTALLVSGVLLDGLVAAADEALTISFFPQVIRGAEMAARKRGYSLIAVNSDDDGERQGRNLPVRARLRGHRRVHGCRGPGTGPRLRRSARSSSTTGQRARLAVDDLTQAGPVVEAARRRSTETPRRRREPRLLRGRRRSRSTT